MRNPAWWAERQQRLTRWVARQNWLQSAARRLARISTQLYFGIGAALASTLIASLVAWLAFDSVGGAQSEVNDNSLPQLAGSFRVAQHGSALAVAASRLAAATTREELREIQESTRMERQAFEIRLSELTNHSGERFDLVRARGGALITNIGAIEDSAKQAFALRDEAATLRARLASLQTGSGRITDIASRESAAAQLLSSALSVPDSNSLDRMRERFENVLAGMPGARAAARLQDLGLGRRGGFALRAEQLALADRQELLLDHNRDFAAELLAAVEGLVSGAQQSAATAALESEEAIGTGRLLLALINGISIVAAVLIAWLFVGKLLLSRLQALSNRMLAMAEGELETAVDIGGRDEVADMAAALEVFRRHALEVQRLNLVEKYADELSQKNDQLESTLQELHRAQNQIVAREKLAGLGELTAGVAHEMRNPLNFVFNFSEASGELLEELYEELDAKDNEFNDAQKQLLQPIYQELAENLQRIRAHGGRAERIVSDMLKMGGTVGERQLTDVNDLLRNLIRLESESAPAVDAQEKPDIRAHFDPAAGQVEIVVQEISRVFQNLIANARDAIDARLRAEDSAGSAYEPVLSVATRRSDDRLEVRVRDNGTGIPEDVVDKIFDPFFTTKPTDQGTGLGLSLCNDILRGHGGAIRVDTRPGEYTEMILELPAPKTPPPDQAER